MTASVPVSREGLTEDWTDEKLISAAWGAASAHKGTPEGSLFAALASALELRLSEVRRLTEGEARLLRIIENARLELRKGEDSQNWWTAAVNALRILNGEARTFSLPVPDNKEQT